MGGGSSKGGGSVGRRKRGLSENQSPKKQVVKGRMRSASLPNIANPNEVNMDFNGDVKIPPFLKDDPRLRIAKSGINSDSFPKALHVKPVPPVPERKIENEYTKYPGKKIVVGIYDYPSDGAGDLKFQKDDRLVVLREEGDWYYAKHLTNNKEGYIPSNYVAAEKSLESYDWYHGDISRKRAEKDLHAPGNIRYTFLIRDSSSEGVRAYALSVLDEDADSQKTVKHYRIRALSDNKGFYLVTTKRFSTLEELVNFYKDNPAADEKLKLSRPCAKAKPTLWELSKDKWEVSRGDLEFGKRLGAGKFGEVHQGLLRTKPVAIKTLKEGEMDPVKFLAEAAIMKQLRHRKLVALYAVCSTQQPFYIITELMSNGCLLDYLRKDKGENLKLANLIDIAGQVADGMMFIEIKRFIHRDLAARNVLVGEMNQIKIGDFGLATAARDVSSTDRGERFPVKWTAPEALRDSNRFSIKSDVWSYGILLVELMTYGAIPYPDKNSKEAAQFVEQGNRHPRPLHCPESIYDLMLSCWKRIPEHRPTFESLYGSIEDYAIGDPNNQYQ